MRAASSQVRFERRERGLGLADVERRGHEGERHHHAGGLQHEAVAGDRARGCPAGPTEASSAMPATAGGSTSGSSTSVTTSALPAELARGQQVGGGRPHQQDQRERGRGGLQAEQQRVAGLGLAEAGDQLARAGVEEDRRAPAAPRKTRTTASASRRAAPGTRRRGASGGRGPDAASRQRRACPGPSSRLWMNACAARGLLRALHHRHAVGHRRARGFVGQRRSPSACRARRRRRCGRRSRRRPRPARPCRPRPSRRAPRSGRWPGSPSAARRAGPRAPRACTRPPAPTPSRSASLMPGLPRSSSDDHLRRPRPARPARARWWRTRRASPPGPPWRSASGSLVLAAAKTSGFTPLRIWAASSSEPANEKRRSRGVVVLLQGVEGLGRARRRPRP